MAGLRPEAMRQFYAALHARRLTTDDIAAAVGRNRATVTRVLNGSRRRGPLWRRIAAHLAPEELRLLDVAQCDTWNSRRVERRPRWTEAKARILQRREAA